MSEIFKLIRNLSAYFDSQQKNWTEIDEIFQNEIEKENAEEFHGDIKDLNLVKRISVLQKAVANTLVLSILQEVNTAIRNNRDGNAGSGFDNTYDCWDRIIEIAPREKYLTFIYAIAGLANYQPQIKFFRKLSMAAASTYYLSLTIQGSKGFHIFDDQIISRCLEVFKLIETLKNDKAIISENDRVEIWVNFMNLCDDLKIMFRYVHFDKYKEARNLIIWELVKILYNNHSHGFENIYAANLHGKCYEIFEEVINAHNGDPEETLMKIMRMSYILHTFPPIARFRHGTTSTENRQFCGHISDWFSECVSKYPRILPKILHNYIECVITNPEKGWRTEQLQKALDYASKYDAILYTKCNESILTELTKMLRAEDSHIRQNAVEMCNRIVLINSNVDWEVFRHEVSNVPREVFIIKEIILRLQDINNGIKLKAIHGLYQAYMQGSENSKKIIKEGISFATFSDTDIFLPTEPRVRRKEPRYARPQPLQPEYTYEGYEIVQPYFDKLPNIIYGLWNSPNGYLRKAAINMIEPIVILNPLVIYNTNFVKKCLSLSHDPNCFVRKQALQTIDKILEKYPNCFPIIYAWCSIIMPLFEDFENKNIEIAWECFKRRVFDNIKEQFMPWIIIRVLLSTQKRQYLQACINEATKKQAFTESVLNLIVSHTLTSNSTEAWILLSFVSGRMKCKEPDSLISSFIKSMTEQSWNAGQNLQIILEVLSKCVKDFSHSALNTAFSYLVNLMKEGALPPTIMGKAFDFCMTIKMQSENKRSNASTSSSMTSEISHLKWVEDIHSICEKYLKENLTTFYSNKPKFMSYIFLYSETNVELPKRPNEDIIKFIMNGIREHLNIPEKDLDSEDVNTLNQFIILSGRFSIRDSNIAAESCSLFSLILKKIDRSQIINTVLVAITDLCKRHTQTVELVLNNILHKLNSPYLENRIETFKNLTALILQDQLKLRGNILLSLTTIMLDENVELSNMATEFFLTYVEKKNSTLFQTCLLECPYVYNEYMGFDGFESFSGIEMCSPLKGENNQLARKELYNAFILGMDEINLLMYFENVKLLNVNIQKDFAIKSEGGLAMIKDLVFILTRICEITTEDKKLKSKNNESNVENETDVAIAAVDPPSNDTEKTKRGKRNAHTMNDAITTVEKIINFIPKIYKTLIEWNASYFEKDLAKFCVAFSKKFDNLLEKNQAPEFWDEWKDTSNDGKGNKRKTVVTSSLEEPLNQNENPISNSKRQKVSDLPTSILFHPFEKL